MTDRSAASLETTEPRDGARVAIVGGGIMGITLAYFLTRHGAVADVYEASDTLGGLAAPINLPDGTEVDRYYHAILSSDSHLRDSCEELGIADRLRFTVTPTAVFTGGGLHTMNTVSQLLRFQPLPIVDRFRLGLLVALAQFYRDWHALDRQSVQDWLVRLGGRSLFRRLWHPMLASKFDGEFSQVAATWMWARLVRMKSTRDGKSQRERAGHLIGGYATLLSAMAKRVTDGGGRIHLRCPVERIAIDGDHVVGLRAGGELHRANQVAVTMQGPVASHVMASAPEELRRRLSAIRYLGIVCPLIVMDRPLTGAWTVNIADPSIPFTGVIETTSYIDPKFVGGHHLVYVPKYTAPGSRWLQMPDEEVQDVCLRSLARMFPTFSPEQVRYVMVHREAYVDPLHPIDGEAMPEVKTAIRGLYLATSAQIYPALTSGESVTRHAASAADLIASDRRVGPTSIPPGDASRPRPRAWAEWEDASSFVGNTASLVTRLGTTTPRDPAMSAKEKRPC
jgi:protoporphyrinogen oxidase